MTRDILIRIFIYLSYLTIIICSGHFLAKLGFRCNKDQMTNNDKIMLNISYIMMLILSILIVTLYVKKYNSISDGLVILIGIIIFILSHLYIYKYKNEYNINYIVGSNIPIIIFITGIILYDIYGYIKITEQYKEVKYNMKK